ncbi:MAG: alkaline phosphatase D family protein [Dietzia sp.]
MTEPHSPRLPSRRSVLRGAALAGTAAFAGIAPYAAAQAPAPGPGPGPGIDFPTCCPGPFANGIGSGDPLSDRVIIWTRVMPERVSSPVGAVQWAVAADPDMTTLVASGVQTPDAEHDFTVKVDVTGLSPATTYYYRFTLGGERSITGRTRTAPAPGSRTNHLRIAVMSCSSYWSSQWSGFENLANRNDIDLVVHLGDYIYDFPDADELVRSRVGFDDITHPDNRDWLTLSEVRRRYALWRSDPQFVRAHQQHPWTIVWDNHDIDPKYGVEVPTPGIDESMNTTTLADTTRAFYEWTPTRPVRADGSGEFLLVDDGSYPVPQDPLLIYRRLRYGDLVDVFAIDAQSGLDRYELAVDSSHLHGAQPSLLGRRQFEWLTAGLAGSTSRWRLIANQAWFSPADIPSVVEGVEMPRIGIGRWADFADERTALVRHLRGDDGGERIRNTIMVSGDAHGNYASDIIETTHFSDGYVSGFPGFNRRHGAEAGNHHSGALRTDTAAGTPHLGSAIGSAGADPANPRGRSVGVEFSPSSMGRGGADEMIISAIPTGRLESIRIARAAEMAILSLNRNAQFVEWVDHGYGIVDITRERAVFEYWWQDKYVIGAPDVLGHQMVAWADDDHSVFPPRLRDQIDSVDLHGLPFAPTSGTQALPAPRLPGA